MLAPSRSGGTDGAVSALDAAWALQVAAGLRTFDADQTPRLRRHRRRHRQRARRHPHPPAGGRHGRAPAGGADLRLGLRFRAGAGRGRQPAARHAGQRPVVVHARRGRARAARRRRRGQNFRAIAFGDCTGNWQPPAAALRRSRATPCGSGRRPRRDSASCACAIAAPAAAQALELELRYDPARLRFTRVRTLGARDGLLLRAAPVEAGVVRIAAASATDLSGLRLVALVRAARCRMRRSPICTIGAVVVDETAVFRIFEGRRNPSRCAERRRERGAFAAAKTAGAIFGMVRCRNCRFPRAAISGQPPGDERRRRPRRGVARHRSTSTCTVHSSLFSIA